MVAPGYSYQHHPDHRNGVASKSQWTITEAEERNVFEGARIRNWLRGGSGWGLHIQNTQITYLGISRWGHQVFVAKFLAGSTPVVWHGYPADHQRDPKDRPEREIVKEWETSQLISPGQMRKLLKGQPCDL